MSGKKDIVSRWALRETIIFQLMRLVDSRCAAVSRRIQTKIWWWVGWWYIGAHIANDVVAPIRARCRYLLDLRCPRDINESEIEPSVGPLQLHLLLFFPQNGYYKREWRTHVGRSCILFLRAPCIACRLKLRRFEGIRVSFIVWITHHSLFLKTLSKVECVYLLPVGRLPDVMQVGNFR